MSHQSTGLIIIGIGLIAVLIGVLVWTGALSWFGRLPGDIRIKSESVRVYIPITSMLLISAALTLIAYLVRRFAGR